MSSGIPPGVKFLAENHVNVIYPPKTVTIKEMEEIVEWLNNPVAQEIIRLITGNTQVSKNELEGLMPIVLKSA